jgi:hypothetical protein
VGSPELGSFLLTHKKQHFTVSIGSTNIYDSLLRRTAFTASGNDTAEWVKTYTDMAGRAYKTVYPDGAYSQSFYNTRGQLWKQRDPDGVVTLYQYNALGQVEYTAVDMNRNDTIDSLDRLTRSVSDVIQSQWNSSQGARRSQTWVYDDNNNALLASVQIASADGLHSKATNWGVGYQSDKS